MMQISGDTLQFLQEGKVMKISNEGLSKINYAGGNTTHFTATRLKSKKVKAVIIAGYPDAPIEVVQDAYFVKGMQLKKREVNEMFRMQTEERFHKRNLKFENTNTYKTLFLGVFVLGAAVPISYLLLDSNRALWNVSNKVNTNSRYIFTGIWAVSGIFTIAMHNSSALRKKELIKLYNSTFYPGF